MLKPSIPQLLLPSGNGCQLKSPAYDNTSIVKVNSIREASGVSQISPVSKVTRT